jgi:hypothetical protein
VVVLMLSLLCCCRVLSNMGSSHNTDVLGIVYANCRSLAHEVYPASQAHAVLVAQSCSLVACSSVADLKALL